MILCEPLNVMLQRIKRRRRDDAALPHAAAEEFANAPRFRDELARPRQRRADRRTESLAETDRNRIKLRGPCLRSDARGNDGVPEAGPVEMQDQSVGVRPGADGLNLFERIAAPAATIV